MSDDLTIILDQCLQQMKAGATVATCLERHPAYARQLAPLLGAAEMAGALRTWDLPADSWLRHRSRLMPALSAVRQPRARLAWPALAVGGRSLARVAVVILVLCLGLSVTAVAASQPGDLPYHLRLLAERVPIWFESDPGARGVAELHYADHRLTDVRSHLIATDHVDPTALQELLASDEAAAQIAAGFARADQTRASTWITGHASCLLQMSETALGPHASDTLRAAAEKAAEIAGRARGGIR